MGAGGAGRRPAPNVRGPRGSRCANFGGRRVSFSSAPADGHHWHLTTFQGYGLSHATRVKDPRIPEAKTATQRIAALRHRTRARRNGQPAMSAPHTGQKKKRQKQRASQGHT